MSRAARLRGNAPRRSPRSVLFRPSLPSPPPPRRRRPPPGHASCSTDVAPRRGGRPSAAIHMNNKKWGAGVRERRRRLNEGELPRANLKGEGLHDRERLPRGPVIAKSIPHPTPLSRWGRPPPARPPARPSAPLLPLYAPHPQPPPLALPTWPTRSPSPHLSLLCPLSSPSLHLHPRRIHVTPSTPD